MLGLSVATFSGAWRGPCIESSVPIMVSPWKDQVTSELRVNCSAQGEEGVSQEALPGSDQAKKDQITRYVSTGFTHQSYGENSTQEAGGIAHSKDYQRQRALSRANLTFSCPNKNM